MRILYFASTSFYSKPNPSFHLMFAMISDLLSSGHDVYYVGKQNIALDKHIPDEFLNHPLFHYRLAKVKPVSKNQFAKRYLSNIWYTLNARKYIKEFMPKCDVVYIQSGTGIPYFTIVARHYAEHQKILVNVQDMFPGSSIASGIMPRKYMQQIFYAIQKIAYKKADKVVGISEDMRDKLLEQGVPYAKTEVILNWFDDKTVHYVDWDKNRYVKKVGMSKNKFYVQYAGTMGYVFDYKMVLDVAARLRKYKDIEFQMIGMGSQKDAFEKSAEYQGLDNIKFYPLEAQEMVSDVYSSCSICYIPLKHGIIGNSVPSKAGLLMECKKAIVTSADADSKYLKEINSNQIGIACPDNDPKAVADAILYLYEHPEECKKMGERGYLYGHNKYSRSHNMKEFIELFQSMCN